ncbi:MAG: putative coproporphyrinogen oxidase [Chlamydiota bacterium]|jgi:oxygen-independent coproporphyrinogen-3 oxidase
MAPPASIYVHVPFCTKLCPYCHFYVIPNRAAYHDLLTEGLSLEWDRERAKLQGSSIVSVYFGGGTPALFPEGIRAFLNKVRLDHDLSSAEITVEANPESIGSALLASFLDMGVNRLSLGVQSLDDALLQKLGRTHSAEQAINAIQVAHQVGFNNISIDLMFDVPDQTLDAWEFTFRQVDDLPITHLSLYNLTIEPHTVFYRHRSELKLPTSEESLAMHETAMERLSTAGFERYEISAFCKNKKRSIHNIGYWQSRPFHGFGPSAFSDWDKERYQNTPHLFRYVRALRQQESPVHFREKLPPHKSDRERLAVALRMLEGVLWDKPTDFLQPLIDEGFLVRSEKRLRLSNRGLLFYDLVAEQIIDEC